MSDNSTENDADETCPVDPGTDSAEQMEALDLYLTALQQGDAARCVTLRGEYPEVVGFAPFLEQLDRLGPESTLPGDRGASLQDVETFDDRPDAASSSAFSPATEFGKYTLLGEVGRGGMGVIYKALQKDLNRVVALKMILSSRLASTEEVRRFYIEARAAGSLRHPHIVGIHEVGEVHGQHYFSMEYVAGRSLAQVLREQSFAPEQAAALLAQVARAVNYLHTHDIVHRDLKPSNILIDADGNSYVADFGLAKVFQADGEKTQTGTILGTPGYMAPEQAAGHSHTIDCRSDIYSLGAILYELLAGCAPFACDNPLDTLLQVLEREPQPPSEHNCAVPPELEVICLRCLSKNPADRYESAAQLADDLDCWQKGEPISVRPVGLWRRVRSWARNEPALASHLSGLVIAAAIVQIKYMYSGYDFPFHLKIMSLFGVWAIASCLFQKLLNTGKLTDLARCGWIAADSVLLTNMLCIADGPIGPLLVGYPLLITASGQFFQVRMVWYTTLVSMLSYSILLLIRSEYSSVPHYPILFAAVLMILGLIVAHQVERIRTLSQYFEGKRFS